MKPTDEAILAHSGWKDRLKKAIDTGKCDYTAEQAANNHACVFGKWLDSIEAKHLPNHAEISGLHQAFHRKASEVLDLALKGHKSEALHEMESGRDFSLMSSRLINELARLEPFWNRT